MQEQILLVFLKKRFFHLKVMYLKQKKKKNRKKESKEEKFKKYIDNTFTFIEEKSRNINNDLIQTYFKKLFKMKDAKKTVILQKKLRINGVI